MSDLKTLKRGEKLFEENKGSQHLYIVTSGRLNFFVTRSNKRLDLSVSQGTPVLGEESLFSSGKHIYTAEAAGNVQYSEIPLEPIKAQIEKMPQVFRLLLKSLADEVKVLRNFLKSTKLEQETLPCPQPMVARVFASINIVTRQSGKKQENGEWDIGWETLKLYSTRFFLERHNRVHSALEILAKLGYAELHVQKNEDGIEELHNVRIKNLDFVEQFAEFYQFHYYKPGKSEVIYFDKLAYQIVRHILDISVEAKPDHKGHIRLVYDQMLKDLKEKKNFDFKADHIRVLEHKGFMASRRSTDTSVLFLFDRKEFETTLLFWNVIHEIDKWNETGRVNMHEEKEAHADESQCPDCHSAIEKSHKFCPNCGFKIAA